MTLLAARKLTVAIENRCLVEGLDLDVQEGEIWGVLGRNGVGKTTLLMTLAGIRQPHAGEVLLDNQNILFQHRRAIARRLGMLVQHTRYAFEATCLETVLVGLHPHLKPWEPEKRVHRDAALALLDEVGLAGLEDRIASTLSGGEARRLALATLLMQNPDTLLMDEPTNHLDPANQVDILNRIGARIHGRDRAGIMALHEVNLATCYCSHVLLLYGEGEWEAGASSELLEETRLSRLYQCPIRAVDDGRQRVFAVAGESRTP